MKVVLAEKPSVARELASFLGASARREGHFEGNGHQVTWALGHLVTLKEPQDYDPALKSWSIAPLPIVPERFELKPIDEPRARKQLAIVARLFRSADELICATDAGREGELIFRYIQILLGCERKPARRLWLSSLTEGAIRDAFRHLRPLSEFDPLYDAARCRGEADWIVGLNATRYYTVDNRGATGGLLWSVGRVQTPVLALIVRRDDEIRAFKPEPFWELLTHYREAAFRFQGDRFKREEDAQAVLDRVVGRPFAVRDVQRKPERDLPPQLFDLTELQREMNRRFGMSADSTLKAAQSLYESKFITYPRTDSRYLSSDMKAQVPKILADLRPLLPAEIGRLDLSALPFSGRTINNAKVRDHHAIVPTGKHPGALSPAAQKVFDAVATRLIAAFYPPRLKEVTIVDGESNEVPFRARGVRVLDPGWTVLYPRKPDADRPARDDEQELPEFHPGETGPHEPFVRRGETAPPRPYTESSLLGAMETAGKLVEEEQLKEALKERGLGTPATRAAMIETLLERGYIARERKILSATDLGRYLIAIVRDRGLKSPELTGDWEAKLRQIERRERSPREFIEEIARYTREIVRPGPSSAVDPDRLGDCPRCGRAVVRGKRGYGCSGWRDGCPFVLWPEHRGQPLDEEQIRTILQQRVLGPLAFDGPAPVLLHLTDGGALVEIPVPTGERRFSKKGNGNAGKRPRSAGASKSRKGRDAASTSEPALSTTAGPEPRPDGPSSAKRKRAGTRTRTRKPGAGRSKAGASETPDETAEGHGTSSGPAAAPREKVAPGDGFAAPALGRCPLCGAEVVNQSKSYGCSAWRQGCRFAIWKSIAGKAISPRTAQTLLERGRTAPLKGFRSKAGNTFEARLKLEDGAVRFDFERESGPRRSGKENEN